MEQKEFLFQYKIIFVGLFNLLIKYYYYYYLSCIQLSLSLVFELACHHFNILHNIYIYMYIYNHLFRPTNQLNLI